MIALDGNYGEAGGQIARTALALSVITGKAFEVSNIRKGRCQSGLKNQHLYAIRALKELYNCNVEGDYLGSHYLKFIPGKLRKYELDIDIETAGSITLLLQAVLPPLCFSTKKVKLKITGGTDTKWSMPVDYFSEILLPQLRRYADIDFKLIKRGYYPKGNGLVEISVKAKKPIKENAIDNFLKNNQKQQNKEQNNSFFKNNKNNQKNEQSEIQTKYSHSESPSKEPLENNFKNNKKINLIEQGNLIQIKGSSHASSDLQKAQVAERQAKSAELTLKKLNCPVGIRTEYCNTLSTGSGIMLYAIFSLEQNEIDVLNPIRIGSDSLGERGKKAEIIGKEAAEKLINEISCKAPVDCYLADNLIPWLGLFSGKFKTTKISNHTLTNIYVCEHFLDKKFSIDETNKIIEVK